MVTLLCGDRRTDVARTERQGDEVWLTLADLERASGWTLKPEGVCLDDRCVPLPRGREHEFMRDDRFNLAAFWRLREGPIVSDAAGQVVLLGEPAETLASAAASGRAPDFTLPDLAGRLHSLHDHAGKKVLLVAWASW